jgi:nitroreductase
MTPTIELLRSHRSIRHFTDAPMSDEQRAAIIASAQALPARVFTVHLHYSRYRPGPA